MRYAIFSDLHDSFRALNSVLDHAARHQADFLIYLGDVGHNPDLFHALRSHAILCLFGNWEVSGYQRLPSPLATEVAEWPALHSAEGACFCHATPAMPSQAATTQAAARYMKTGQSWHSLFPRLHIDESARWDALAALDAAGLRVAFHGHTHIQMIWTYGVDETSRTGRARWRNHSQPGIYSLQTNDATPAPARYLVGVGSAGQPNDGRFPRCALYDSTAHTVELCEIQRPMQVTA